MKRIYLHPMPDPQATRRDFCEEPGACELEATAHEPCDVLGGSGGIIEWRCDHLCRRIYWPPDNHAIRATLEAQCEEGCQMSMTILKGEDPFKLLGDASS